MIQSETTTRISSVSLGVIAIIATGWFLRVAQPVLVPIVLGALVAFLMDGVSRELERIPFYSRVIPKWLHMTMTTIVFFLILMVGVGFFVRNLEPVVRAIPQYAESLSGTVSNIAARFDYEIELTWKSLDRVIFDNIDLQLVIRHTLNSVSYTIGYMVLVFLYAILFLIERNNISSKLAAIFPEPKVRKTVWHTVDLITNQIGMYFTTKTMVNAVLGVICWFIFLLFGVEFAAFFAVLTAIFNYIPYVGSWIAMALPMLFALGSFGFGIHTLVLFCLLSAAQFGVGSFWEPRLMGRSMNLSPVIVMVSLAVWTAIWGLIGAILSVILTSAIMTILSFYRPTRPVAILLTNTGEIPSHQADVSEG
ncbi:AI-2E family transporter [Pseudopelagicola sp. nBUS_19]|uniref:AI-2E family transporter n=1 Tax=unclassified Pseudopelagicola TaxID=2649563 RepID=UPI003EB962AA